VRSEYTPVLRDDLPDGPRPMLATLIAREGHWGALRDAIAALTRAVRAEPGCLAFVPLEDVGALGPFDIYEVYANREVFEAHLATQHVARSSRSSPRIASPQHVTSCNSSKSKCPDIARLVYRISTVSMQSVCRNLGHLETNIHVLSAEDKARLIFHELPYDTSDSNTILPVRHEPALQRPHVVANGRVDRTINQILHSNGV
jgi:quinol monooxygenase YgiN